MTKIFLTERALADIAAIEIHSVQEWGRRVADQNLSDLDAALGRLAENLSLFKERHDYRGRLRFHRVREHALVGDVVGEVGYVLAVWHGSMDFIDRLSTLEPDLLHEAEIMAGRIVELDVPEEGP